MPGMNGLAALKRLLLIQPSANIVMISAEHDAARERRTLDSGACAFLHKSFTSQDVDRVLHAAFGLRSPNLKVEKSKPNFDVAIEARPSGPPARSSHFRVSVELAAALPAQRRGAAGSCLRHRRHAGRRRGREGRRAAIALRAFARGSLARPNYFTGIASG